MGIIRKQTIKGSIYSYIGVAIGFLTTALIYPRVFSTDEVGLLRILIAWSALFAQFSNLGFTRVTTMLFPYFRNYETKHNGFFPLILMVSAVGLFISLVLLLIFKPFIIGNADGRTSLLNEYFYFIIPLIFFSLAFLIFDNYYKVLYNAVLGTIQKEFIQRLLILSAVIIYMLGYISFREYVYFFLFAFFVPAFILLIMLIKEKQISFLPDINFLTRELKNKMIGVSFYGILTSFSGILVLNIDSIMINYLLDLSNTGIYAVTFFFGVVIMIPSRSLLKISSVVIADSWKANNIKNINDIYFKSCLNQMIIACLLFIGVWSNIHNVFDDNLLPAEYEAGKYVIFFISLASVIQMSGGTSNMILYTSPRFKTHTYFMVTLVILLILTNLLFIPIYGITGAAIASALSFLIFNVLKYIYLRKTFNLKPYNYKIIMVILVTLIVYGLNLLIPINHVFWIDIIIRSVFITIVYMTLIISLRISEDIQTFLIQIIQKIRGKS